MILRPSVNFRSEKRRQIGKLDTGDGRETTILEKIKPLLPSMDTEGFHTVLPLIIGGKTRG